MLVQQLVHETNSILLNIFSCQIQDELIAYLSPRPVGKWYTHSGCARYKSLSGLTIPGLHHKPEIHSSAFTFSSTRSVLGGLLRVHIPISQPGFIIHSLSEPSIVYDEQLHADGSRLHRKLSLQLLVRIQQYVVFLTNYKAPFSVHLLLGLAIDVHAEADADCGLPAGGIRHWNIRYRS